MRVFLDIFIPPSGDGIMPGAGSLGLGPVVATNVEADPVIGPIVSAGLQSVRTAAEALNPGGFEALSETDRLAAIRSALVQQPRLMNALGRHLYPAYYQHPQVLVALGEPARPPFPEGFDIEPTDERLLSILADRRIPDGREA